MLSPKLLSASALLSLCSIATAQNSTNSTLVAAPVVDLGYTKYRGVRNATWDSDAYYGIYYAASPTKDLRWRAPVPIEQKNNYSRTEIQDASYQKASCIQPNSMLTPGGGNNLGSEDCLLMDILKPIKPKSEFLPVWVEIHGGCYYTGDSEEYPGYALMHQAPGEMVYVTIQYRLNKLGFLAGPDVKADGTENAGLLDQRLALEWIQRHISKFGGDPNRVTISGNSAGGGSVMNHMIMFGGADPSPPFQAGIPEYPWYGSYLNQSTANTQYRGLLESANCTDIKCLRDLDEPTLSKALTQQFGEDDTIWTQNVTNSNSDAFAYAGCAFQPIVDGIIIRDLPSNEFKQGNFAKVPTLVQRDGDEGFLFTSPNITTIQDVKTDLEIAWPNARDTFWTRLFEVYPASSFNSSFFQRAKIYGDSTINCPTGWLAKALADYAVPTWKLIFNAGTQKHGATQAFLFATDNSSFDGGWNNNTLAQITKDWYLSFVINGDPNAVSYSGVKKPFWNGYYKNGSDFNFPTLVVNYTDIQVVNDPDDSAGCDFLYGQTYVIRN